ncbi:hypothetical protein OG21DRAFT_526138 [Imleria badia]|nr:hypothetical protein OG21DRAFT_526138 [Imleria badia]
MQSPANTTDAIQSVYQILLSYRLRTLHGDALDARTNWVTTASGPLQRPTYTALCYFDGVETGRGSGPTRDAAKESAAARALARLPRSSGLKIDDLPSTNQPSSSFASQRPPTHSVPEPSADVRSGWRARMAKREAQQRDGADVRSGWRARMAEREAQQRDGGEHDQEIHRAQPESQETSPTMLRKRFSVLWTPPPLPST